MIELIPDLFVGDIEDYEHAFEVRAIVSATKTVHKQEVRHNGPDDPNYIAAFRPYHAILNWVDGPSDLYEWSGPGLFTKVNDFIEENLKLGTVLVHCDAGLSRSATTCMVFLAKRRNMGQGDYGNACDEFARLYPRWQPGGILDFVAARWSEIR